MYSVMKSYRTEKQRTFFFAKYFESQLHDSSSGAIMGKEGRGESREEYKLPMHKDKEKKGAISHKDKNTKQTRNHNCQKICFGLFHSAARKI